MLSILIKFFTFQSKLTRLKFAYWYSSSITYSKPSSRCWNIIEECITIICWNMHLFYNIFRRFQGKGQKYLTLYVFIVLLWNLLGCKSFLHKIYIENFMHLWSLQKNIFFTTNQFYNVIFLVSNKANFNPLIKSNKHTIKSVNDHVNILIKSFILAIKY